MVIGATTMTNSDFLAEIYGDFAPGTYGWVCSFRADPSNAEPGVWAGRSYKGLPAQATQIDKSVQDNTYFCTSALQPTEDGEIVRRKEAFAQLRVLVLDDANPLDIANYTYAIQTSPGNFQIGIVLDSEDPDTRDGALIDRVMQSMAARGYIKADKSGNNRVRYCRLPVGMNTKPRPAGEWQVRMEHWHASVRWSLDDACAAIGIDLDNLRHIVDLKTSSSSTANAGAGNHAGEMILGITDPNPANRAYHDSITRLAASLVAGGMFPGAAVDFLYSLMDESRPSDAAELARWQARRAEIPRAVKSAEKFAPEERKPPQITVNLAVGAADDSDSGSPGEPAMPFGDLQPMDWGALAHVTPEPTQWRYDGWLPEGTVTLLAANGGVGKSNLSLQLGVALAHGASLFDIATKPSRVLILSGEDEAKTVHFRVSNICADMGVEMSSLVDRLMVYDLTKADCVLWKEGGPTDRMQWLADVVVASKAQVVIVDNASDVFAANENDRTEVRGFMRCLNLIAGETRAAVMLLAHVDKASARGGAGLDTNTTFSGSTAWNNSARSRWAMVRDGQSVLLRHEKCNHGALQEELRLEFDPAAKVFRRFGTTPGLKAAAELLRNSQRAVIMKLIGQAADAGVNLSWNSNRVDVNIYRVLSDNDEYPNDLKRREFYEMITTLRKEGLIVEQEYRKTSGSKGLRVILSNAGLARVAIGSGAPPTWAQRDDEEGEDE